MVRSYNVTYGMDTVISRGSNTYGPYQYPEKLIPLFITEALEDNDLPVYGDGLQVRDWLHVEDHCRGITLVLDGGTPGEMYNIGGGAELPNLHVIDTICSAVDEAFVQRPGLARAYPNSPSANNRSCAELKTFVNDRAGHDRRYAIDYSKIESQLGYRAQHSFAQGFSATLDWYLNQESWWRALLK